MNVGQTCVAPDYLLVHHSIKEELIEKIKFNFKKMLGDDAANSKDYGRIINLKRFKKVISYLGEGKVVFGGKHNENDLFIEPTILDGVSISDSVMQEVVLTDPILTLGAETGAPKRMTAKRGVYNEKTRILRLSGDVRIDNGSGQRVATNDALVDTRSGRITGNDGLVGDGPLGQMQAKSYDVDRDTGRVTLKGGVRARLEN